MSLSSWLKDVLTVVIIAFILATAISGLTDEFLFIGYVETISMEPTINAGDGYVSLPSLFTTSPSQGDLIIFESREGDADMTVHRIESVSEDGFITRGDNNIATDQEGGEPVVTPEQVVGKPVTIGGSPITIPGYAIFATTTQSWVQSIITQLGLTQNPRAQSMLVILGFGLLFMLIGIADGVRASENKTTTRTVTRPFIDSRIILLIILVIVIFPLLTASVLQFDTTETTIEVEEGGSGSQSIDPGENQTIELNVENNQFVPTAIIVDAANDEDHISPSALAIRYGQSATTEYTITAPTEEGRYVRTHTQHHYPHILPVTVISLLHGISPILALGAIITTLLMPVILCFWLFIGFRPVYLRDTRR